MNPPASRLTHLPPFLHTPGIHRPDDAFSSQCSPLRKKRENFSSGTFLSCVASIVWTVYATLVILFVSVVVVFLYFFYWNLYYCLGLNRWQLQTLRTVSQHCYLQVCVAMSLINYLSSQHLIHLLSFDLFCEACCPPLTEIQTYGMHHLFGIQLFWQDAFDYKSSGRTTGLQLCC